MTMKIQMALLAALGLTLGVPSTAAPAVQDTPAASAKEKKIRKLLEVTGSSAMGKQVMDAMLNSFSGNPGLPAGFIEKFKETAQPDKLVELIIPIYLNNLDEETIDGALAFFETPAGKKFIKAQPTIVQQSMAAGQKWGAEMAEKTLKALNEK
jgi:hypothetical protein